MFNIIYNNQKAMKCVIDNVLITIRKRSKTAKMRKLSACSGICMFKKIHSGGPSTMYIYIRVCAYTCVYSYIYIPAND